MLTLAHPLHLPLPLIRDPSSILDAPTEVIVTQLIQVTTNLD